MRLYPKKGTQMPYGYLLLSGLYLVVYEEDFTFLYCDHHAPGTIAVDLFTSQGEFVDGICACPRCVDNAEKCFND